MTYTENIVNADLRARVFEDLIETSDFNGIEYKKVNDRQYGTLMTDKNGHTRYVRIGVIVAEEREDMTARELMESEIRKYQNTQKKKADASEERAKRAKMDKEKRARKAQEKAKKQEDADDANQYLGREIAV